MYFEENAQDYYDNYIDYIVHRFVNFGSNSYNYEILQLPSTESVAISFQYLHKKFEIDSR